MEATTLIKENLLAYCLATDDNFRVGDHHRYLSDLVNDIISGKRRKVCISLPPRHGKSYMVSQKLPCWYLGNHPNKQVIAVSYAASLAQEFGRSVRDAIDSSLYANLFGPDAAPVGTGKAGGKFTLSGGGKYRSVGVRGSLTGFGGDLIIVDDPTKDAETADSPRYKEMLEKFFSETLYTRLMPGGSIIVMATRWRHDDLIGYILKNFDGWEYINIPAISFDDGTPDPLGRGPNEALWPEMYNLEALLDIKRTLGDASFNALYQGRPVAQKSATLTHSDVRYYRSKSEIPSRLGSRFLSIDTALSTKSSSDYSAITVWAPDQDRPDIYLLDAVMDRLGILELTEQVMKLAGEYGCDYAVIENSAAGQPLKQLLEHGHQFPAVLMNPTSDKVSRFANVLPFFKQGQVHMPSSGLRPDLEPCYEQLYNFPKASHDDFVDSCQIALQHWSEQSQAWQSNSVSGPAFSTVKRARKTYD